MKAHDEVRRKYLARRRSLSKEFISHELQELPCKCVHNHLHTDGSRLCMLGSEDLINWPGNLCQDEETSRACPFFKHRQTESEVLGEFEALLEDKERLKDYDPELAALTWVLEPSRPAWYTRLVDWLLSKTTSQITEEG
jgi:hypothetical protein